MASTIVSTGDVSLCYYSSFANTSLFESLRFSKWFFDNSDPERPRIVLGYCTTSESSRMDPRF